ncbi:MAG: hypothetical protein MUO54_04145 [Anaerolineales bacterium]|nr:hypothetical protein [Anaerolineales bacterium]
MDNEVITVLGSAAPQELGLIDAHNHIWISPQEVPAKNAPILNQESLINTELIAYRNAGGGAQVDCQPGGAGRDGNQLRSLSESSGVIIIACTGFHLREYYPEGIKIWDLNTEQAADYFLDEINLGLEETRDNPDPVFPGFIKIAVRETLEGSPQALMEAAANASLQSGLLIEMHTERGADIERFTQFFSNLNYPLQKLVICHVDKRPDLGLHTELAQAGCLLEYDTFFRPKYHPEENLWPLIDGMVSSGYAGAIACATDLADSTLWNNLGSGPGLVGFIEIIKKRLELIYSDPDMVIGMLGGNIANRLLRTYKEI